MAQQTDVYSVRQSFKSDNPSEKVIDPVCGMQINYEIAEKKGLVFAYLENKYPFCCVECMDLFKENPDKYLEINGIKLIVKKDKLQEAIDTLHALENQEIIPPVCTLCGGREFIEVPVKNANNYVKGMLTWLFKGDNEVTDIFYKCANCGKETEQLPYPES